MAWKNKIVLKELDGQQLIIGTFRECREDEWQVEFGIHFKNGYPQIGKTKEVSLVIHSDWAKAILISEENN